MVCNGHLRRTLRLTPLDPIPMATEKKYEITVTTRTAYIPEQSDPDSSRYVFAYTITIRNTGTAIT